MPNRLSLAAQILGWIVFLFASAFGYIALKRGVESTASGHMLALLGSKWTWTAVLAWTLSTLLWIWILRYEPLLKANSISTIRYVLLMLGSWIFLQEQMTGDRIWGMSLIAAGVYLVIR